MYVRLLVGVLFGALIYGALLETYTPGRLIQVIQGSAVVTVGLTLFALWKQEARNRARAQEMQVAPQRSFRDAWSQFSALPGTLRMLFVIGLGTFGYGMADVLLEPYGGQALGFSVAETTKLTALLAGGTLAGFGLASRVLGAGGDPTRLATFGASIGIPGFAAIVLSSAVMGPPLFIAGTVAIGFGAGLFGHATLTATIRNAPPNQIGLSIGTWGAVQATCAGIGVALAGVTRDVLAARAAGTGFQAYMPYNVVFMLEIAFLILAILALIPLAVRRTSATGVPSAAQQTNPVEVQ